MKKLLTLILILMMILSLAACGDDKETTDSGENNTSPATNTSPITNTTSDEVKPEDTIPSITESDPVSNDSLNSVKNFLEVFGLTEEDVKPEFFIEFGDMTTSGQSKPGEVDSTAYFVIKVDPEKTQADHIKMWFEQLYSTMQTLSEDGKIHSNTFTIGTDSDKEITLDSMFTNPLWEKYPGTMWSYPCKLLGKDVNLNIAISYDIKLGVYSMSFTVFAK